MSGRFHGGWKDWLWLAFAALLFLTALIFPLTAALADDLTPEEQQLLHAYEEGELIRLHIVAHSDSAQDQTIKLAVRDAIIDAFGDILAYSAQDGCEAAFEALKQHEKALLHVAKRTAQKLGFEGAVVSETGVLHLPQKTYGSVVLPEGEYRALRITIGSGLGKNWWCVLFPQLCLSLAQDDEPSISPRWDTARIFQNWLLNAD